MRRVNNQHFLVELFYWSITSQLHTLVVLSGRIQVLAPFYSAILKAPKCTHALLEPRSRQLGTIFKFQILLFKVGVFSELARVFL